MADLGISREEQWAIDAEEELRLDISNNVDRDPEIAARVLNVAGSTGLPMELIESNLDELEKKHLREDFDAERWIDETPGFASFAAENPYHLAVLKRDQKNLGWWERTSRARELGWQSGWAKVEMGRIYDRHVAGNVLPEDEERLTELTEMMQPHDFGASGFWGKLIVRGAKEAPTTFYAVGHGFEMGALTAIAAGGTALALGQLGPQVALPEEAITVPAATLAGLKYGFTAGTVEAAFRLERGFAYGEYIEMGLDTETALLASNAAGGVNAALEAFSIRTGVKYIPGVSKMTGSVVAGKVFKDLTFKRAARNYVLRYGEVLGVEVVTEVLQESVTMGLGEWQKSAQGIMDQEGEQDYIERVTSIAVQTLWGAGLMSAIGPSGSFMTDSLKVRQARKNKLMFQALDEAASGSTTKADTPEQFKAFTERVIEKGGGEFVHIDREQFREYFQEIGMDPDEMAQQLGIANMDEAGGVDLEIPMANYAEYIAGSKHHAGLLPDLKFHADDMSMREAEQWQKEAPELMKALQEGEVPDSAEYAAVPEIYEYVTGALLARGFSAEAAEKQATFNEFVFSTMAERNPQAGMDAWQLFQSRIERIEGEGPAITQPENVDATIDPYIDRLRMNDIPTQGEIFGESLLDFIVSSGGLVPDPELEARDFLKETQALGKIGAVNIEGATLDGLAESAYEANFIPARDPNLLLEAIERELAGEAVFTGRTTDIGLQETAATLDELQRFITEAGIDLETMTNEEVRKALGAGQQTLAQLDATELKELMETIEAMVSAEELVGGAANEIGTLLAEASAMLPEVAAQQDFQKVSFVDRVRVKGLDKGVEIEQPAQKIFNRAVKRRGVIQKLLDCVSG